MSRTATIISLAVLALACQAAPQPAAAKKADSKDAKADANAPAPDTNAPAPAPDQAPAPEQVTDAAPGPAPAWFDPGAFEHAAIIKQDLTGTKLTSGQSSAMIVLELPAGTTPEQCIERARAKLGESIPDLPANITTPQGYLQVQGKHGSYEYAVVCGVAKDKPTMFLSYTQ